jgi:hypothetical protein
MLFVKVPVDKGSSKDVLTLASQQRDWIRRVDPLIEAYQGIFAGTRIATVRFAMETAGLGCPKLLGLDVVERPARGMVPNPGQAARGLQPWCREISKESPCRRF